MATKASSEFADRLAMQGAAGWQPKAGDTLVGIVMGVSASAPSEYGIYPIMTLATEPNGDPVNVHCFHEVLRNRLLEKKPAPGERIAIQYLGEREGKNRAYHSYAVVVDRPDAQEATAWNTFEPVSEEATANEDNAA